eukprot:TRINITY_DN520_c0_g1_i1.p1 TRINITY_DN520_c0_g1~~TRINITY_DN520_c0_g1_i1.p1  ORF type:complete len:207 (-),score=51.41 TRINITY_DN520_c0_g1_i1:24-644(-)
MIRNLITCGASLRTSCHSTLLHRPLPISFMSSRFYSALNAEQSKLLDIMKTCGNCMLVTKCEGGQYMRGRPMHAITVESDDKSGASVAWFMAPKGSPKVKEIKEDASVCLTFANETKKQWASVNGPAELVDDRNKIKELWQPMYTAWFPKGKEDPEIVLVKMNIEGGEYWDSHANLIVVAFGAAKAAVTGQRFDPTDIKKTSFPKK